VREAALADARSVFAKGAAALADMRSQLVIHEVALADVRGVLATRESSFLDMQGELATATARMAGLESDLEEARRVRAASAERAAVLERDLAHAKGATEMLMSAQVRTRTEHEVELAVLRASLASSSERLTLEAAARA